MSAPTTSAVAASLAQHLHNLGLATYSPTGAYPGTPTHPAVFFGRLADRPDRAVAITHYNTDPEYDTHIGSPLMRFQLRWRGNGDPRTVWGFADAAAQALRTKTPATWPGGVHVLTCWRSITAPIEADSNERWMRADSYEIRLNPIGAQP